MNHLAGVSSSQQTRALTLSTIAFTVCFAVWTIFAIIGVQIKKDLGLNDTQFGLLIGTPILTGSLTRLFLGIWTDQFGGRLVLPIVMLTSAVATFLLTGVETYQGFLAAALGVGMAGGAFAVGVAYVSRWYPKDKQGTALGVFGMGNVGAAVTKFLAPFVMVAFGWEMVANVWASVMVLTAVLFYLLAKDDPVHRLHQAGAGKREPFLKQLEPLKHLQVWRFCLYYFFVFGAFVGLALWLPRYLTGVYDLDIKTAGMIAALYSLAASVFRAVGGWLSDKFGARTVMYWTFIACAVATFLLSYPTTDYTVHGIKENISFSFGITLPVFIVLTFVLGFFMSLGKAAVYKHIPVYYPQHVGSVGGVVGMVGGLGGFILPIVFGALNDIIGVWTSCFMLLFGIVMVALIWMHLAIRRMELQKLPELGRMGQSIEPDMNPQAAPRDHGKAAAGRAATAPAQSK